WVPAARATRRLLAAQGSAGVPRDGLRLCLALARSSSCWGRSANAALEHDTPPVHRAARGSLPPRYAEVALCDLVVTYPAYAGSQGAALVRLRATLVVM